MALPRTNPEAVASIPAQPHPVTPDQIMYELAERLRKLGNLTISYYPTATAPGFAGRAVLHTDGTRVLHMAFAVDAQAISTSPEPHQAIEGIATELLRGFTLKLMEQSWDGLQRQ